MGKRTYITIAMIAGGLIVGAAIEHIRMSKKIGRPVAAEPEVIHHVRKVPRKSIDPPHNNGLIASLRAEIAELKADRATSDVARSGREITRADAPKDERRGEGWQARMERMKSEEPERYAEMEQRRAEFRLRMEERKLTKQEFLESIDTATMNAEQLANHERLKMLTERVNEITEMMISGETENRRELRHEMFQAYNELRELNNNARVYLLEQTASAVGYKGAEAELFIAHLEDIIGNTTMQMRGATPGGGRGRGGMR